MKKKETVKAIPPTQQVMPQNKREMGHVTRQAKKWKYLSAPGRSKCLKVRYILYNTAPVHFACTTKETTILLNDIR